ncbi:hypothetical protein CU312_00040 [Prochlorococcus marinus str. MU1406]|nr:hypothetical protein [Prochlorococcus marinus str. MU1406]
MLLKEKLRKKYQLFLFPLLILLNFFYGVSNWRLYASDSLRAGIIFDNAMEKYENKDYKGAINDLTKYIEIYPKDHKYGYFNRGVFKDEIKDYKGAIRDYSKAIKLYPSSKKYWTRRSLSKFALGKYRGALKDINKALLLDSSNPGSLALKGIILHKLGDKKNGCNLVKKSFELGNEKESTIDFLINFCK